MTNPTMISEIARTDLGKLETPVRASITEVNSLSSYNWIEAAEPSIAVPGIPALWSPPKVPLPLKKDSGLIYIAQNAARLPESPLEPLFRALFITNPSFDIRPVDVVTDRNNIRKLLSFVDPGSSRNGLEAFTIKIEVTKNTAVFCRDETKTTEYIAPDEFRGFGHEFEKAYTIPQLEGSTGHHRIISYRFGGLNFVVRHETDGSVGGGTQEGLSSMLGALSLSSIRRFTDKAPGSRLVIKKGRQWRWNQPLRSKHELPTGPSTSTRWHHSSGCLKLLNL